MRFYWLVVGVLGVWRITHLLADESGPWEWLARLRRAAGTSFWGGLLGCFYCLSVWVAAPFAFLLGEGWREWLLLWPGLSGGAILLERLTNRVQPARFREDEDENNVVLRKHKSESIEER